MDFTKITEAQFKALLNDLLTVGRDRFGYSKVSVHRGEEEETTVVNASGEEKREERQQRKEEKKEEKPKKEEKKKTSGNGRIQEEEEREGTSGDNFQLPRQKVKRAKVEVMKRKAEEKIEKSNRYAVLEVEEMVEGEEKEEDRKAEKKRTEGKKPRIAPIVIRQKERWIQTSRQLQDNKINYTKAKVVKNGIEIVTDSEDDYRKMNAFLKKKGVEFYTFDLRSEKPLKIVLKGIPQEITEEEVKEDLEAREYKVQKVTRMKGKERAITNVMDIPKEISPYFPLNIAAD